MLVVCVFTPVSHYVDRCSNPFFPAARRQATTESRACSGAVLSTHFEVRYARSTTYVQADICGTVQSVSVPKIFLIGCCLPTVNRRIPLCSTPVLMCCHRTDWVRPSLRPASFRPPDPGSPGTPSG